MKKSYRRRGKTSRANLIVKLISWFDSYVELYTIDPLKIQRSLRGYEGTDIDQIWKSVKKDAEQIADLPSKSDEIGKYVKRASRARIFSMILAGVTFLILFGFLYAQNQMKVTFGSEIVLIGPAIAIAILYISFMYSMLSTRRLNKTMRSFYDEHARELKKETARMRDATQQMIDRLSREVYSQSFEPRRFSFQTYSSNYRNVTLLQKRGIKFVLAVKQRGQKQASD